MDIIGAGFPRTGTLSTHAALTTLGFPCYHMAELATRPDHIDAWYEYLCNGASMPWRRLFADFKATVDAPAAHFWQELLDEFPDAKVLLNVREPEKWIESFMRLNATNAELRPRRHENPSLDRWLAMLEALERRVAGEAPSRADHIRAFNEHNALVQELVPADRLLVFRVKDGWQPLCEFLGRKPPDEPFPHLNEGTDTVRFGIRAIFGIAD